MLCPRCKKELPEGVVFCKYCGGKVESYMPSNAGVQLSANTNSNRRSLIILSVILAAAAIFMTILYFKKDDELSEYKRETYIELSAAEEENSQLQDANTELQSEIDGLQPYKDRADEITGFLQSSKGKLYNQYKNYHAYAPVVFVKKGETAEITGYLGYDGNYRFTVDDSSIADCKWEKENISSSTAKTIVTGKKEGTTLIHYLTRSFEDNYYVMVVVY